MCAPGYTAVLCTACADGYFDDLGACSPCPASGGPSVMLILVLTPVFLGLCCVAYVYRGLVPMSEFRVGLTLLQVRTHAFVIVCVFVGQTKPYWIVLP